MAKKRSRLERMRSNPRSDWKIADIEKLCSEIGLVLVPPSKGSHFKVYSKLLRDALTVPAHRPIKPPYIRNIVSYADAHLQQLETKEEGDD